MTSTNRISFLIVAAAWTINSEGVNGNLNEQPQKDLPLVCESFPVMRNFKHLYIDKSEYLNIFLSTGVELSFITRPRRFGKTVFLEMMRNFFMGKKEHFDGLFINYYGNTQFLKDKIQECGIEEVPKWMKFPVIYLDFGHLAGATQETFKDLLYESLETAATKNGVDLSETRTKTIGSLVKLLYRRKKMPVIILIDEYDKPIQDALMGNNVELTKYLKNQFEHIFTQVKASKQELGFCFMVGVSKLPYSVLQTGANSFHDFSYDIRFAKAFGFTKEELRSNMMTELEEFAKEEERPVNDILKELLYNYNGYCFNEKGCDESMKVMNPISTMRSLTRKQFANYWSWTSSMKHIAKTFYSNNNEWHFNDFETGYVIQQSELFTRSNDAFLNYNFPIYLFLFGYTTINKYDKKNREITLAYPNEEIRNATKTELIRYVPFAEEEIEKCCEHNQKFRAALKNGKFAEAMKLLQMYEFIQFKPPSADGVTPQEITRRFGKILNQSSINYIEGVKFYKDNDETQHAGDIDFLTLKLDINIIISIKCSIHAEGTGKNALKQLTQYYQDHPKNFISAMEKLNVNTKHLYFLGIGFVLKKGGEICEWVVLPLRNNALVYSDSEGYPESLKNITK